MASREALDAPPHAGQLPDAARRSRSRRRPTGEAPPLPRSVERTGVGWMAATVVLVTVSLLQLAAGRYNRGVAVTAAEVDVLQWLARSRTPLGTSLAQALAGFGNIVLLKVLILGTLIALLVLKRFRHLIVMVVILNVVPLLVGLMAGGVRRPRPLGVPIEASWSGFAMPSRPVAYLALILCCMLYTLLPQGRWRQLGKLVAAVPIAVLASARMYLGADHPTDVLVAATVGVTVPLIAFRLLCPEAIFPVTYRRGRSAHLDVTGARGAAIRQALSDQLGVVVKEVKPFNLSGSAGSTPLRITVERSGGEPDEHLFGKLYARGHLRADRWYKLGRELLYGRLEDEKSFNAVRRLVQQEDYALHKLRDAGLPVPRPYGFVELTPDREYLLVTEFFEGATELGEAEVDDQVIDDGLAMIRTMWHAGLAHRDIKPANLLVRDGRMLLIDVAFSEIRPTPWREAVDLANMMLCLALRSDPAQVYERARRQFSEAEITEAFAATRGLTMPSQLRHMLRSQGRDLHAEFLDLLPQRPHPVSIQRWSGRRVMLVIAAVLAFLLGFGTFLDQVTGDRIDTALETTPTCTSLEPLWLLAQSVPSASMVPCLEVLPAGLHVVETKVNSGGAKIVFSRLDADGMPTTTALTTWFRDRCDVGGSEQVATDEPGAQRYERTEPGTPVPTIVRHYVFPGGCVEQRYLPPEDPRVQPADEARLSVSFVTREELAETLERRSDGRLHLDPEARP